MNITPTQRFRSGRNTYEPGHEYDVPDADCMHFVRAGWATSPDYTPAELAATGDVRPNSVTHKASKKEG